MITQELNDHGAVPAIRAYVRNEPHILVYDYIRRGLNGEVYFGKRNKMGDEVVLKFYWSHPNYDATEEAVILRGIKHPNILEIFDLKFLAPSYACFLTPRISGGDLQGIIDNGKLTTKQALEIICGILIGLTELHSKHRLVHRDLKPGNILLDTSKNHPIIADLGAVKKIDQADGFVTASKSTYLYLPPESVDGNKYYFQSDIYQVGIIMFQLLGGYFPVHNPEQLLTAKEKLLVSAIRNDDDRYKKQEELIGKKITKCTIVNTDTLPHYLDAGFKRVISKAIHLDHEKRFKNSSLFLKEIHILLRSYPEYMEDSGTLNIKHETKKEFQIYRNTRNEIVLEKRIASSAWRKDNSHNGTMKSALDVARVA